MFKSIATGLMLSICTQQVGASPLKCHGDTSERDYLQQSSLGIHSPSFSSETKSIQKKVAFVRVIPPTPLS